ncbi:MAG: sensor domain-containing diguanylate cyclase, partial [Methylococcales bacterium]
MQYHDQQVLINKALLAEIARLNKIIRALSAEPITQEQDLGLIGQSTPIDAPVCPIDQLEAVILESEIIIHNLRESDALFRHLFERHNSVMLLIDYQSRIIVDANPAASDFYGYPLEVLRGMDVSRINAQSEAAIHQQRQLAISGEQNSFVFDHRLADGQIRAVEVHISTVDYKDKNLFFSIIHDITDRKLLEQQVHQLAFYDPLTDLPNRRLLDDRLAQAMAASKRSNLYGVLLFLDLDNFKSLNDKHGHTAGDLLLIQAARRLEGCMREMDTVARFGGDEFVIMIVEIDEDKELSKAHAIIVAEKIRSTLAEPYFLTITNNDRLEMVIEHCCTASIGVALFVDHEASLDSVMKW